MEPHGGAVGVLAKNGAGGDANGFGGEGEPVGEEQPVEKAAVAVSAVEGIDHQAVDDEEEPVGGVTGNGEDGRQEMGKRAGGEGEEEEVDQVAVEGFGRRIVRGGQAEGADGGGRLVCCKDNERDGGFTGGGDLDKVDNPESRLIVD